MCVCVCVCVRACVCICSEVSRTAEIAEALQNRLDAYKAEKRELGSVSMIYMYTFHTQSVQQTTCTLYMYMYMYNVLHTCIHVHVHCIYKYNKIVLSNNIVLNTVYRI